MNEIHKNLWVVERPLRLLGVNLGARMTVIRLDAGGVVLHSPVAYEDRLKMQLNVIGKVCAIIAPNCMHNLFLDEWIDVYPDAIYYQPPGMPKIKALPTQSKIISDNAIWHSEIEQHIIKGLPRLNEVAFFHKGSRTLIVTDVVFNLAAPSSVYEILFLRLNGAYKNFGSTRIFKTFIKDKLAFRESIEHLLRWDFETVIMSHGEILFQGGKQRFKDAFGWLY